MDGRDGFAPVPFLLRTGLPVTKACPNNILLIGEDRAIAIAINETATSL